MIVVNHYPCHHTHTQRYALYAKVKEKTHKIRLNNVIVALLGVDGSLSMIRSKG